MKSYRSGPMRLQILNPVYDRTDEFYLRLVKMAGVETADVAVDLGCGVGRTLRPLLAAVGPTGHVIAVDSALSESPTRAGAYVLDEIEHAFADEIHRKELSVRRADFTRSWPLEDQSVDVIICQDVLDWIPDPSHFIEQCYRSLNPEGILFLSNHDFGSAIFNSTLKDVNRRILTAFVEADQEWQGTVVDGTVARRIPHFAARSSFGHAEVETVLFVDHTFAEFGYGRSISQWAAKSARQAGVAEEEIQNWLCDLAARAEQASFYCAMNWVYAKLYKSPAKLQP